MATLKVPICAGEGKNYWFFFQAGDCLLILSNSTLNLVTRPPALLCPYLVLKYATS